MQENSTQFAEANETNSWVAEFKGATKHVMKTWTLLNLAVDHGWGGRRSFEKRIDFFNDIIGLFARKDKKIREIEALADWLAEEVCKRFHTECEDESDYEVAEMLVTLYGTLSQGDFSYAKKIQGNSGAAVSQCKPTGEEELLTDEESAEDQSGDEESADEELGSGDEGSERAADRTSSDIIQADQDATMD